MYTADNNIENNNKINNIENNTSIKNSLKLNEKKNFFVNYILKKIDNYIKNNNKGVGKKTLIFYDDKIKGGLTSIISTKIAMSKKLISLIGNFDGYKTIRFSVRNFYYNFNLKEEFKKIGYEYKGYNVAGVIKINLEDKDNFINKVTKHFDSLMTIEEINQIPIEHILRYLNHTYIKNGDNIKLFECIEYKEQTEECKKWKPTDGWVGSVSKNIITDFSNKGRAQGNPFSFIKNIKNFSNEDTFNFFKEFKKGFTQYESVLIDASNKILNDDKNEEKRLESIKNMFEIYDNIENNEEEVKKYLKTREINYDNIPQNIKNILKISTIHFEGNRYNNKLFIPMYNIINKDIVRVGIKARNIDNNNSKFKSISIRNSYIGMLFDPDILKLKEEEKEEVILCEGEIDALSLYSAGFKNVIGNLGGVGYTNKNINNFLRGFKKILIMYDNDEAGQNGIKKIIKNIGLDKDYLIINYEKIKKNLLETYIGIEIKEKIDINDILKYTKGNIKDFKKIIQSSIEEYNKENLNKEIESKKIENKKEFKKEIKNNFLNFKK